MNVKGIINIDRIKINDMRINKKTITTETKSGRTYVPPRIKLCPLDPESIMAGTITARPYGTYKGQGDADFTGRGSDTKWGGETPTLEEVSSSEYTGGLQFP